jgi:hypothetical protein
LSTAHTTIDELPQSVLDTNPDVNIPSASPTKIIGNFYDLSTAHTAIDELPQSALDTNPDANIPSASPTKIFGNFYDLSTADPTAVSGVDDTTQTSGVSSSASEPVRWNFYSAESSETSDFKVVFWLFLLILLCILMTNYSRFVLINGVYLLLTYNIA